MRITTQQPPGCVSRGNLQVNSINGDGPHGHVTCPADAGDINSN